MKNNLLVLNFLWNSSSIANISSAVNKALSSILASSNVFFRNVRLVPSSKGFLCWCLNVSLGRWNVWHNYGWQHSEKTLHQLSCGHQTSALGASVLCGLFPMDISTLYQISNQTRCLDLWILNSNINKNITDFMKRAFQYVNLYFLQNFY